MTDREAARLPFADRTRHITGATIPMRRRTRRRLAFLLVLCAMVIVGSLAARADPPNAVEHVIPPGQEELLGAMLGLGATLPGDCQFTNGNAQGSMVTAEYACGKATLVLELRHPDDAPPAARRTEQFAIVVRSGAAPAGLLDALESLIRSREAGFHWKQLSEPQHSSSTGPLRIAAVAAAVSGIVIVGLALQFLLRRVLPPAGAWPRSAAGCFAMAPLSAAVLCALAHAALRATGTLSSALLWARSSNELLAAVMQLACVIPAAMLAAMFTAWCAPRRPLRACVGLVAIVYVMVGYRMSLLPNDLHYFGGVSTLQPSTASSPNGAPGGSAVVYRTNALGFREPGFAETKAADVVRVALIGDSYVYGTGVNEDGTLRTHLAEALAQRWPNQRFEVLNLGIPGDNLASHVELFAAATARLAPDAVVLCLTLPNDLSRWDEQVERQDARRLGLFSAVRFLTGDAASWLWAAMRLETSTTPAGLANLDQQLARLDAIRRQFSTPQVLVFFGFQEWDPIVVARLKRIPDTALVPDGALGPEDFIPGDGHPTALGNTRSAARIADALAKDPPWLALVSSTRGR